VLVIVLPSFDTTDRTVTVTFPILLDRNIISVITNTLDGNSHRKTVRHLDGVIFPSQAMLVPLCPPCMIGFPSPSTPVTMRLIFSPSASNLTDML
jgi:hypothetical protein